MSSFITVLDATRILILVLIGILGLAGLGWVLVGPLWRKTFFIKKDRALFEVFKDAPLLLIGGLILNFTILLLVQSLHAWLWVSLLLSLLGLTGLSVYLFQAWKSKTLGPSSVGQWAGLLTLSALYLVPILTQPLVAWDARSIWFFHAKMIDNAGGLFQSAGWESIAYFAHPDYPKLIPSMAAEVAYLAGYWNEFLPKISLFFTFFPALLGLFSFSRHSLSFTFLILVFPFAASGLVWNGYMDGFIYLYFFLGLLLLGRYIHQSKSLDLVSALASLSLTVHIKNEGSLILVSGLVAILMTLGLTRRSLKGIASALRNERSTLLMMILMLLPWGLWAFYQRTWGLQNDLMLGTPASLRQLANRLSDGSLNIILKYVYAQVEGAVLMLMLLYVWRVVQKEQGSLPHPALLALMAALVYGLGMVLVYLATPHDLQWHLRTSIGRTMLPVSGGLFVAGYYLIRDVLAEEQG
jgi:hypothetical protein